MIALRKEYPVFTGGTITMSVAGAMKRIHLGDNDMKVTILGNFDVKAGAIISNFQETGTWYEFFTGTSLNVTSVSQQITLQPGEYRLYTNKYITPLNTSGTSSGQEHLNDETGLLVYPNPVNDRLFIETEDGKGIIELYNTSGHKLSSMLMTERKANLLLEDLTPGVYFLKVNLKNQIITQKIVKR